MIHDATTAQPDSRPTTHAEGSFIETTSPSSVTYVGGLTSASRSFGDRSRDWTLEHSDSIEVLLASGLGLGWVAVTFLMA